MRYVLWTLLIVGLSAAGVSLYGTKPGPTVTVVPESTPYRFQPATCWFDADWKIDIRCGHLVTDNTAGVFTLPVVVIKADKNTAKSAPILYLQGGPGASAGLTTDGIKEWVSWSRLANTQRDLVLLDTRGVGGALPALQCQKYNRLNQQLMRQNPTLAEELAQSAEVTKACFDEMSSADQRLSPANFGSYQSARDIRALMPLLGYEHWHILGVSYGTRLALEVARQEADLGATGLTSMVLDSVYPAGYGGVQTWPQVFNEAIDRFVAECVTIDGCRVALMTN
jgi:pimeloyl-ACP methyl ester carboxylesterase